MPPPLCPPAPTAQAKLFRVLVPACLAECPEFPARPWHLLHPAVSSQGPKDSPAALHPFPPPPQHRAPGLCAHASFVNNRDSFGRGLSFSKIETGRLFCCVTGVSAVTPNTRS